MTQLRRGRPLSKVGRHRRRRGRLVCSDFEAAGTSVLPKERTVMHTDNNADAQVEVVRKR